MRSSVTIRDVARLADVHPGTVSRALNPQTRGLVNAETAERVMRAAKQLGYQPDPIARGLKTRRTYSIGALIPDLTNPLFPPIMRGVEDRLAEAGYTLLTVNTDNDVERERGYIDALRARYVDGFIAATARLDSELLDEVAAAGTPVVLVNRSLEGGSLSSVTVDDRLGSHLAVEHVVALGHVRIAHVAGPPDVSTGCRRRAGFLAAMDSAGLEAPPQRIAVANAFTEPEGARACEELLGARPRVTAIVAANDRLAIGCYDSLRGHGLSCPADVSVVGFNDMAFTDRLAPPLTTVRVPQRELGSIAAELLLAELSDAAREPQQILLEPELIVRASTAAP